MSTRTTVTLDEDVLERVKAESRSRGKSFRETLNELLRVALLSKESEQPRREFKVEPFHLGLRTDVNYDCTAALLEFLEGPEYR